MDNVNDRKKYASVLMSAVLLFSAVSAVFLAAPQSAYAVVTIDSSDTSFYGPGFIRVLVTDTALDELGDTIIPTVEARDGSTTLATASPTIEAIGTSGQFEFFITTSSFPLMPAAPTKTVANGGVIGALGGPFILRVNTAQTTNLFTAVASGGGQVDANGNTVAFASNSYGLNVDMDLADNFRILYGGQTRVIDFSDSGATLTSDRLEAGNGNEIVLTVTDNDGNSDPTLVDRFELADPTTQLTSSNVIGFNPVLTTTGAVVTTTGAEATPGNVQYPMTVTFSADPGTVGGTTSTPSGGGVTTAAGTAVDVTGAGTVRTINANVPFTTAGAVTDIALGTTTIQLTTTNTVSIVSAVSAGAPVITGAVGTVAGAGNAQTAPNPVVVQAESVATGAREWVETGQNTGAFELTIVVDDTNIAGVPTGGILLDAALPTGQVFTARDHSVYETLSGSVAPFNGPASESSTSSVSITLRNRDGAIQLQQTPTLANGLQAQITDADANVTTEDGDDIIGVAVFIDFNGNGSADLGETGLFDFTETDDNTGMFIPDYDDDMIAIEVGSTNSYNTADGIITLTPAVIASEDINVTYTDPASQSNITFTLITEMSTTPGTISIDLATAGINDIITARVNDSDLNTDPLTVETYNAADGRFVINGERVAFFNILAVDTQFAHSTDPAFTGNAMPPVAAFEATFIETGINTGIFEADDIDLGEIDAFPGLTLDDGDEIEFTYDDFLEDPTEDDSVTVTIGRPDASIDTDRSTIPIPTPADPVTVIVTVFDTNANVNTGSTDTVTLPFSLVRTKDGNGAEDTGNADVTALTGLTGPIAATLTETGPNTGIFEEDIDLTPTTGDINVLRNTRVTLVYQNAFGDTEEASVTYRSYDGVISASPQVVSPGNEFIVRVLDQDGNKDPDEREEVDVTFDTDENTDSGTLTLEETGPNTGTFEEIVEVGVDIEVANVAAGDFSTEIELTYNDAITSSGDTNEDRELTVRVATGTGTLTRVPEIVGPGTEITVDLGDLDLNENPNGRDDVNTSDELLEINSSDGDKGDLGAEETGPNTGVFQFKIQFEPRDPDVDGVLSGSGDEFTYTALPGDIIAIQYDDETDSLGNNVLVSMVFMITSQDPEMEAEETTVQPGESILLTVVDHDGNRDGEAQDSIDIDITSDTDPIGFTLAALETGDNTGIFTVTVPTSLTVSSGSINVRTGGSVFLEYNDEFPADYAERKDVILDPSKDFTLVVPVGTPAGNVNSTTPKAPVLTDLSGNTLSEVTVGQQVVLNVSIKNNNPSPQTFAAVVEVKDADGFTVYLQWQTGTMNPNGTIDVGLSFTPDAAGDYTARTYVLSSILNPTVLSPVATSTFTVS